MAGSAVCGFHDSWSAAGHDGVAGACECGPGFLGEFVVLVVFIEARRAEDGDAGANEVEFAEAAEELAGDFDDGPEFLSSEARAFEEVVLAAFGWVLAPLGVACWVCRVGGLVGHEGEG